MKKILSLFLLFSIISCANKDNTELEEAFIALTVLESFISTYETTTYIEGDINCDHGGKYTLIENTQEGGVNGYIVTNCVFTPSDNLDDLQYNCSKTQNQEASGTIDLSVENKITGGLSFKGLYEKSKICGFNLTIGEDGPTSGTICGYTLEEINAGSLSAQNPSEKVCDFLN